MIVEKYEVIVKGNTEDFIPDKKEIRFRCIDEVTGKVLDDAQGYGYKTAKNAYAAFSYKNNKKNRRKNGKIIKRKIEYTPEGEYATLNALKEGLSEKEISSLVKLHPEWIKETRK
jgi:hypothetical protein